MQVTLQSKGSSSGHIELMGKVKGVRFHLPTSLKIIVELSHKDLWEIDNLLEGHDIEVHWTVEGYGFLSEEFIVEWDRSELGKNELFYQLLKLVPIYFKTEDRQFISHADFIKTVLEPVDRFQREYIEIPFSTAELLDRAPSDLKPIAKFIKKQLEELKNVQRDLSSAKTSREISHVITGTRTAVDVKGRLEGSKDMLAEKLYLDTGIFSDEGAQDEAEKQIKCLLDIIRNLIALASGFGVHPTTKDKKKTLLAKPERSDANYLLLMAMLTLGYLLIFTLFLLSFSSSYCVR